MTRYDLKRPYIQHDIFFLEYFNWRRRSSNSKFSISTNDFTTHGCYLVFLEILEVTPSDTTLIILDELISRKFERIHLET